MQQLNNIGDFKLQRFSKETCRQNFSDECEMMINKQINMELGAFYYYQSLNAFFNNEHIALDKLASFYKNQSNDELTHSQLWIDYLNKRGGNIIFTNLNSPPDINKHNYLIDSLEQSLLLEKNIHNHLLELHTLASKKRDAQLCDFIEGNFLNEQVDSQKQFMDMITNAKRCNESELGLFLFNKHM